VNAISRLMTVLGGILTDYTHYTLINQNKALIMSNLIGNPNHSKIHPRIVELDNCLEFTKEMAIGIYRPLAKEAPKLEDQATDTMTRAKREIAASAIMTAVYVTLPSTTMTWAAKENSISLTKQRLQNSVGQIAESHHVTHVTVQWVHRLFVWVSMPAVGIW
jgi:hypothetical protein